MRTLSLLFALLLVGGAASAQVDLQNLTIARPKIQDAVNPNLIAWTQCVNGEVASYVNVAVLGTDSTEEILRHEAVHRRQATDSAKAHDGICVMLTRWEQVLAIEVEAYCASDSVLVRVKKVPRSYARQATLRRLLNQFWTAIAPDVIVEEWKRGCP